MPVLSKQPEVILKVAGEGGGYTILGDRNEGQWRFWREAGGGDSWMLDDEDGETPEPSPRQPAPPPAIQYFDTLDEVLQEINGCWPSLYPIQVHPAFSQDIWNRVVEYAREDYAPLPKWRQCLGRKLSNMDELAPSWNLPAHWHDFANALRLTLANMDDDQFLILLCKGSSRFVQFAAQYENMRAEAISNHFLSRREALSPKDVRALQRLGWRPPTGTPEQATPERDPYGSCNFYMDVPLPQDLTQLVTRAVQTLSAVMAVPHDGYLAYQAFDENGEELSFPALGIKREIKDPDLRMGELADRMLNVLKEITGCATLDFDDDGDVTVEIEGQHCQVRLIGQPPMVRFYLPLLASPKLGKKLLDSLNQLNVHGGPVRHVWADGTVHAMLDIPAWPLQVRHVEDGLALFINVATKSALWLQSEFGTNATVLKHSDMPH